MYANVTTIKRFQMSSRENTPVRFGVGDRRRTQPDLGGRSGVPPCHQAPHTLVDGRVILDRPPRAALYPGLRDTAEQVESVSREALPLSTGSYSPEKKTSTGDGLQKFS